MGWVRPVATCDAETDPFSKQRSKDNLLPQPFVWGFYDGGFMDDANPFYYFETTEEFVEFVSDKEFVCYAHNGGKFDYHYLKDFIEPFDPVTIINGRLARFHIGVCEFRDSWNILPVPLAMYQKQKQDFSLHEEEERVKPEVWEQIIDYLESDCRNLYEVVNAYRERFGHNLTQAGGAMKELNRMNAHKMPTTKLPKFYDDFHPFYYGGRVECFRVGVIKRRFKVVDINSAYPFAMLSKHPYCYSSETFDYDARDGLSREQAQASFFRVRCVSRGAFPWKDDTGYIEDGALIFPSDDETREYNVTGWELLAAEETGTVENLEVLKSYIFDTLTDFKDFVLNLYNERKEAKEKGDKAGDLLAKLALNASYGRFAMNCRRFKDYQLFPGDKIGWLHPDNQTAWADIEDGRVWSFAGHFGKYVLASSPIPENRWRFYNVACAASITGFVRAYLWRALCASSGLLYCDTDSIAAEDSTVPLGSELGEWEIEGEFNEAAIAGKKLYSFRYCDSSRPRDRHGNLVRYKLASKGVKLTHSEIRKVASGGAVTYIPEVPTYRVAEFVDKQSGEHSIARYIPREVAMLPRNRKKLEV